VSIGRTPARFMGPAMLALAVLAAAGVVALQARAGARASLLPPVVGLLVLFEFLPAPFPLTTPHVPVAYRQVLARGCAGPLLELPVKASGEDQKARLFFQALHGCPISGGYLARGSEETPLTSAWRRVSGRKQPASSRTWALGDEIRRVGFQYLVVWKAAYESDDERARDARLVRTLFPSAPVFEDAESALYLVR
jgi:hypothetical protein